MFLYDLSSYMIDSEIQTATFTPIMIDYQQYQLNVTHKNKNPPRNTHKM